MSAAPRRSSLRLSIGILTLVTAFVALPLGFVSLHSALNGPGYGSPEVRTALIVLSVAGALLSTGISLLIWEAAARLGRH